MASGLIIAVLILLALYGVAIYNGLIRARNSYRNNFAQIDVQLTRRHDLIPNLIATAKAYLQHEKQTLEAVVAARNRAVSDLESAKAQPGDQTVMRKLGRAESMLSQTLGHLFALSEAYPDLKANQNMMQLSEELTSTENRIAFARQAYNDSIMHYNNRVETFPASLLAGSFGFTRAEPLDIESPEQRAVPRVSFD